MSIGTAVSVALGMVRVVYGMSLWYFVVPGYLTATVMAWFSRPSFAAIGFDAAAVTTGPLVVTFISSMAVGAAGVIEGRNPLTDGFGLVALVALVPVVAVLTLGLLYVRKEKQSGESQP